MLVIITSKCNFQCPHCLSSCGPNGEFMSKETWAQTLSFIRNTGCKHVAISGGEPTLHPDFVRICHDLNNSKIYFSICTNGSWYFNKDKAKIQAIIGCKYLVAIQIYTNRAYYPMHDKISNLKFKNSKIFLKTSEIRSMQGLGRAREHPEIMEKVFANKYHSSCAKVAFFKRHSSWESFFKDLEIFVKHPCCPTITYEGKISLSESVLCPSISDVWEQPEQSFAKVKQFIPCGGCYLGKKTLEGTSINDVLIRGTIKGTQVNPNEAVQFLVKAVFKHLL